MINKGSKTFFVWAGLLPAVLLAGWLHIWPVLQGLYISMFRWSGLSAKRSFIGLDNFKRMLSDEIVWMSLGHDIYIVFFKAVFTILLALCFSGILYLSLPKTQKAFSGIFFFPNILSVAIVAIIFTFIYNPSIGLLNTLVEAVGGTPRAWLGDYDTALPSILFPTIWGAVGYQMLLINAAMTSIPKVYSEVALLEGASKIQEFFKIVLPLIKGVLKTCLSLNIINTLNETFIFIRVMTNGGPNNRTQVLGSYMYYQAFENYKYGYATSVAVVNFLLAIALTLLVAKFLKHEDMSYA